jgi:glycolate oxidase
MPEADQIVLSRRDAIVAALRAIVPGEGVIAGEREMRPFESDGLTAYRQLPMVVVLPSTTQQVSDVLRYCYDTTSRWCRAAPAPRFRAARCRSTTACCSAWRNSTASARSITTTAWRWSSPASPISRHPSGRAAGFYYAPDPSSQIACTIGGNVAENSGGVHCLKYGMTTNNVLGCEMVLITGEVIRIGGRHLGLRRL